MKFDSIGRWAFSVALVLALVVPAASDAGSDDVTVSEGKAVSIEYTLTLDDDEDVYESNVGKPPLTYIQGANQLIPGLENALEGMKVGDSKEVVVKPEDGYGAVNDKAFLEVDKKDIPEGALKVGTTLRAQGPDGQIFTPRISEIREDTVILDFNHPLAGKTLHFKVKVVDIKDAPAGIPGHGR